MIVLKEIKLFCTNDAIKNLRKFGFFLEVFVARLLL